MRAHHPDALARMVKETRNGFLERILRTRSDRLELTTLERSCRDPRRFPVHVLADDFVSDTVKHIRKNGTGMPTEPPNRPVREI